MNDIIGSVVERSPISSACSSKPCDLPKFGFPESHHRSKSIFSRNRVSLQHNFPRHIKNSAAKEAVSKDWRKQISIENEKRVQDMTEEERESERQDVMQHFGPDVGRILRKARLAREEKTFAKTEVNQIDDTVLSSIELSKMVTPHPPQAENTEATAEDLIRGYFPDSPIDHPSLAWMTTSVGSTPTPLLRFDLSGQTLPPSVSASLPTHLGLHHHSDGINAGYTLDDIFLLSRSTVPAQRATMLRVLARIAQKLAEIVSGGLESISQLSGKELELRMRIMSAGIESMSERGSVGAWAIEAIWQCIVGWDEEFSGFCKDTELDLLGDLSSKFPLQDYLHEVTTLLRQGHLTPKSRYQLLSILVRLAKENQEFARSISMASNLISVVVQTFLAAPTSYTDEAFIPEPFAIEFFTVLASSSRSNALALKEIADVLLRFLTMSPVSTVFPIPTATSILISTLRFYKALASYGLCAEIASTTTEIMARLAQCIMLDQCKSQTLSVTWMDLLESWIVCAIDPHRTTPKHAILWSQISAWGWYQEVNNLRQRLGIEEFSWDIWAGIWRVNAAWLEGAKINGIQGGLSERKECVKTFQDGFQDQKEKSIISDCLKAFKLNLQSLTIDSPVRAHLPFLCDLSRHATMLSSVIRLFVACIPPKSDDPLVTLPFLLPLSQIADLCADVVVHPVWSLLSLKESTTTPVYSYLRSLSSLLLSFLQVSKQIPEISKVPWFAQGLSIIVRSLPGDEGSVSQVIDDLFVIFGSNCVSRHIQLSSGEWDRAILAANKNFIKRTLHLHEAVHVAPVTPTPQSILLSSTLRLPSTKKKIFFGLPLSRDWSTAPLDHLLRSRSSNAFESSCDVTIVEIVRASLILTAVVRDILDHFCLHDFILTHEEAVIASMKIFMLENDQAHGDSIEEVFRDEAVQLLMDGLLQNYTIAAAPALLPLSTLPLYRKSLEEISARFLGNTSFFQHYTDFVSLYDAISFSHPQFARLLLPSTSMRSAIDYRKYLWIDFGHVVKTICTPLDQVISSDLREFLWPLEQDSQMIGAYLRSLSKGNLRGFVYFVALHHIACNIWLHDEVPLNEGRAGKLLHTVISQCKPDVVRDLVSYHQLKDGKALHPPQCFGLTEEQKDIRQKFMRLLGFHDQMHYFRS